MRCGLLASMVGLAWMATCCAADSGLGCCPRCGGDCLVKVCKQIPDVATVTEIQYSVVTEDICLPGPSRYCGKTCISDPDARGGMRRAIVWEPTCGRIITRKKLKKETVKVEKPVLKCVVDVVCERCGACQYK